MEVAHEPQVSLRLAANKQNERGAMRRKHLSSSTTTTMGGFSGSAFYR